MRRISFALLSVCLLFSLAILSAPAKAGDYYEDGYRSRYSGNVSYSSSCCYKKIVRHVRTVRYVRVDDGRPYYRNGYRGYYGRPYRYGYYDAPYRRGIYYNPQSRYVSDGYYTSGGYYHGVGYSSYADTCTIRRTPVLDGRGGWVWSSRRVCY